MTMKEMINELKMVEDGTEENRNRLFALEMIDGYSELIGKKSGEEMQQAELLLIDELEKFRFDCDEAPARDIVSTIHHHGLLIGLLSGMQLTGLLPAGIFSNLATAIKILLNVALERAEGGGYGLK